MFVENIFDTRNEKRALMSYLTSPFLTQNQIPAHANYWQSKCMAAAVRDLGFDVDICDYYDEIDLDGYHLILGLGHSLEEAVARNLPCLKIFYATDAHSFQRNRAEFIRLAALADRRLVKLPPARQKIYADKLSAYASDAIICTGNAWTMATYADVFRGPIYRAPVSVCLPACTRAVQRDFAEARKNFLWVGSGGNVLKGLDLAIEAFVQLPDCSLNICGPIEPEIEAEYANEFRRPNIIRHGFVDVSSNEFEAIVRRCAFTIFPAASEGGAGSVLTAMGAGLIPIVTAEASVDIGLSGFLIEKPDVQSVLQTVREALNVACGTAAKLSAECRHIVERGHSLRNYDEHLRRALSHIVGHETVSSPRRSDGWPPEWRDDGAAVAELDGRRSPQQMIDCRSSKSASVHFDYGWAEVEEMGTWTLGREAALHFHSACFPDTKLKITARILPFIAGSIERRETTVIANGQKIATWSFERSEWLEKSVEIPNAVIGYDGFVQLQFAIGEAPSPAQLGINDDHRRLGLLFNAVTIAEEPADR
jgi:glycosyltransferase involved in cell wall biosynthesis